MNAISGSGYSNTRDYQNSHQVFIFAALFLLLVILGVVFGPSLSGIIHGGDPKIIFHLLFLLCLVIAVGTVWAAYTFFSTTGGLLSIWERERYIPLQYEEVHRKLLQEFSSKVPGSVLIGTRCEWAPWAPWRQKEIALPPSVIEREPHMLLLGVCKKGKTRLLANLISNDIESGERAVVVIDSNGALIDLLTSWIAAHPQGKAIAKRVLYLDPTNVYSKLSFNPLAVPESGDMQSVAKALVDGFKAIYTEAPGKQSQWDAQIGNILHNSALLLMANGKTLADLPALLEDNDFRDELLQNIYRLRNPRSEYITMLDAWAQYKKLARTDQWITWVEPILNRVGPMLGDSRIRPILTGTTSDIQFTKVLEDKLIVLVKLSKGDLDTNATLLGSLLVTGLKQAATELWKQSNSQPSALYLDNFDKFIGQETIDSITRETERYQIGLIGSMKTLQSLPEDFRNQLTVSMGNIICFSLLKTDGDLLGPQMFRVDGRKIKLRTISNFLNPVNSAPQFEYISDEALLNVHRLMGQNTGHFFFYRVGTRAGVFHLRSHKFSAPDESEINRVVLKSLLNNIHMDRRTSERRSRTDLVLKEQSFQDFVLTDHTRTVVR